MGLVDLDGEEMIEGIGIVLELAIAWQRAQGGVGIFLRHVGTQMETALQIVDMGDGGALGVVLHTAVDGGVYLETVAIEIDTAEPTLAEFLGEEASYLLTQIGGGAVIYLLYLIFTDVDGQSRERVVLLTCEVAVGKKIVEHSIAARKRLLVVAVGVVGGGSLEQAYEDGALLNLEFVGSSAEISVGSGAKAVGVGAEVHCVDIHLEYLALRVEHLQLGSSDTLLGLHDNHAQSGDVAQQSVGVLGADAEHILGQLLGDGRSTAGTA